MKKFLLSIFAVMLAVFSVQAGTVTDKLVATKFAATSTSYTNFTGVKFDSEAVYAGNSAKASSGAIQLRSDKSTSGIVTTKSGGKVKKIVVEWQTTTTNGRTLEVYGKNSAYTNATDLYSITNRGTKIGTIVKGTSTELEINGDYEYIGLRSNSGAMYLTSISITWDASNVVDVPDAPVLTDSQSFSGSMTVTITSDATVYYTTDGTTPSSSNGTKYTAPFEITETTTVKAVAVNEVGESEVVYATYTKIEPKTIAEVIADGAVDQAMTSGTVVATYSRGFLLGDGTGYILVYQGASLTTEFSAGDVVVVSGPTNKYNGFLQFQTTAVIEKTGTAEVAYPNVTTLDGEAMDAYLTAPSIQYVEYTGKLTIDGSYYNIAVDGASTAIGSIQYPKENVVEAENNDVVKVTGYTIGVSNSSGSPKYVNTMAVSVEVVEGDDTDPEEPTEPEEPENPVSGTEVTGNAAVNYGTATIDGIEKFEVAPVTLTFAKNNSSTAPAYNKAGDCRIYAKGSITATCSAGNLTKIVFTISAQGKKRITDLTPSTGTVTIADDHSTVTWEGNASEVVLTVGETSFGTENGKAGQICFTEFTATYVIPSYTLSVTDAGYATLFLDFNAAIPAGVEAYTVTKVNDGYVTLTQVTGVLPANTGVIVKAGQGDYTFAYSTDEAADVTGNLLKGTVVDKNIEGEAYVLGVVEGKVGLYKAAMTGTSWKNNANKAYLPMSAVANKSAEFFGFDWDGTTGISEVKTENGEVKAIYDLTGRKLKGENGNLKGIYIINGKKVLVK